MLITYPKEFRLAVPKNEPLWDLYLREMIALVPDRLRPGAVFWWCYVSEVWKDCEHCRVGHDIRGVEHRVIDGRTWSAPCKVCNGKGEVVAGVSCVVRDGLVKAWEVGFDGRIRLVLAHYEGQGLVPDHAVRFTTYKEAEEWARMRTGEQHIGTAFGFDKVGL